VGALHRSVEALHLPVGALHLSKFEKCQETRIVTI
jgi:hypothetical protein